MISFIQDGFFKYFQGDKEKSSKMMTSNTSDYSLELGYCYGFSYEYLIFSAMGKGDEYIRQLNHLYKIIKDDARSNNSMEDAKLIALKMHANSLLDYYMRRVALIQGLESEGWLQTQFLNKDFMYPIEGKSLKEYMKDSAYKSYIDYRVKSYKNKEMYDYSRYMYQMQKIKIDIFLDGLVKKADYFKTDEGNNLLLDPWFQEFYIEFSKDKYHLLKEFSIEDANRFRKYISKSIERDNYLRQELYFRNNNVKHNKQHHDHSDRLHSLRASPLEVFFNKITHDLAVKKEKKLYRFSSTNHSMAIVIDYKEGGWEYNFFNPNMGIIKKLNKEDFFNYLREFVIQNADYFKFTKLDSGDYSIDYTELNVNEVNNGAFNKLNFKDIQITTNYLLAKNNHVIYLDDEKKYKFVYKEFNTDNNLLKLEVYTRATKYHIYTNELDSEILRTTISQNLDKFTVFGFEGDIFVSKYGDIHRVDKKFNMAAYRDPTQFSTMSPKDYINVNLHLKPRSIDEASAKTGIPEAHQNAIARVANEYNVAIGIRPVDPKSTSLIESGMYSSKGLAIKGKSSDWGPHSGFIPVLQQFAKGSARNEAAKFNQYIQSSIEQGKALTVTLELSAERINELIEFKAISPLEDTSDGMYKRTLSTLDGYGYTFLLKAQGDKWQVYYQDDQEVYPFEVIGDPKTGKAMTADYDLFSVIFPISELEHYIKTQEMPTWAEWKASVNYDELTLKQKALYSNEAEYNKQEGPENGITNKRIKEINRKLNKELGLKEGFELIHHGADDANPASVMADNFPITFILPEYLKKVRAPTGEIKPIETYFSMNSQGTIIINNVDELSDFQQLLINEGYRAPQNRKWSEGENAHYFDPKRKLSSSFINTGNMIKRKMSLAAEQNNGVKRIDRHAEKLFGEPIDRFNTGSDSIYDILVEPNKVQQLLERIAINEISIEDINLNNHSFLDGYFTNENGDLDYYKLRSAATDPLIASKINAYLNSGDTLFKETWDGLFDIKISSRIQTQANDTSIVLQALRDGTVTLKTLSLKSQNQLEALFPSISGLDSGKLMLVINNENEFLLLKNNLLNISGLSDENFIGEYATFKNLSLQNVYKEYSEATSLQHQQFNSIVNQKETKYSGVQFSKINHGLVKPLNHANDFDKRIGVLYGAEFQMENENSIDNFLGKKSQLEKKQHQGILSDVEMELLQKIQHYSDDVAQNMRKQGVEISDQSILNFIGTNNDSYHSINNSSLLMVGKSESYVINHTLRSGEHTYRIIDPNGFQLKVKHADAYLARKQFNQLVTHYFNEEVILPNGQKSTRSDYAGFGNGSYGMRADLQLIDFDTPEMKESVQGYKERRRSIARSLQFVDTENSWIYVNGEKISLAKLHGLGATIEGRPLISEDTVSEGWVSKLRFNAESLAAELTMLDAKNSDNIALLKLLYQKANSADLNSVINANTDFNSSRTIKEQLKLIVKNGDMDSPKQVGQLVEQLHNVGVKLTRFQRIGNHVGQVMGAAGAMQTVISLYSLISQLDDPDLTDDQRQEIEKQIYISCGSAFANYGDMVLQPILLKIANNARSSSLVCSRLAAGVVIVFNLVGMGFDAYQAYDNLSKLDSVTDPKQRQDLIVNAALSMASFVVNGITVIGVVVASSSIPVIGLVIGGVLLVGGWVYNGVRAVENIKQEIDISWDRELEEGIRGAFGLQPTLRTRQELTTKHYIEFFKKVDWETDLERFERTIAHAGFKHHLNVIEKPITEPRERFYLVCDGYSVIAGYNTNYFGGKKRVFGDKDQFIEYLKDGAPNFTQDEIDILQNEYVLNVNGEVRKRTINDSPSTFRTIKKSILDRTLVGTEPSSEYFNLNSEYDSPLLRQFVRLHQINNGNLVSRYTNKIYLPDTVEFKLYSIIEKIKIFGLTKMERYIGKTLDDGDLISRYLNDSKSGGISFNSENGTDVIIGMKNRANAFQALKGNKYFVGGQENDYFYLRDNGLLGDKRTSLLRFSESLITKYFDGQGGNDTLIIEERPNTVESIIINLSGNQVIYSNGQQDFGSQLNVAYIDNIENIIIRGDTTIDKIHGDENDNTLDGGSGEDQLFGYGGDDRLVLSHGTADGGDDNDTYHIRRYDWEREVENVFSYRKEYNTVEKKFEIKKYFNKEKYDIHNKFVNINESSTSSSIVNLEYDLNEIIDLYVEGNNLILQFELPIMEVEGKKVNNYQGFLTVNLNNVYKSTNEGRILNHNYHIRTRDGFLLNSQLTNLDNKSSEKIANDIFEITYLQSFDQHANSSNQAVYLNTKDNIVFLNGKSQHAQPKWGKFTWLGLAEHLTFDGNDGNDSLTYVSAGNKIKVSLGQDMYRLDNVVKDQADIIFDFSTVRGRYSEKDKVVLLLPTLNGFDLQMDGTKLVLKDRFGITQFAIRLENFDESMRNAVIIQDKHSNLFSLDLQRDQCTLIPVITVNEGTDSADNIVLPKGYITHDRLVNGGKGDDGIVDYSGRGNILLGGEGDDIITATGGHNTLYGGSGSNYLTGGEGNDLLLSSSGFDTLQGGKGNDHYLVDGSQAGLVYIDDSEGENHIHLMNFTGEVITEEQDDGSVYHRYLSEMGKIVVVKSATTANNQVHSYLAPSDRLKQLTQNSMDPLISYLHSRLLQEQNVGRGDDWQPILELSEDLRGIELQHRVTLNPQKMRLNLSNRNDVYKPLPTESNLPYIVDAQKGDDVIINETGQGIIVKGGQGNDQLLSFSGKNVFYGGKGNDICTGGENSDLLISVDGSDLLQGGKGNDSYLVYGHGVGDVIIRDIEGRNRVSLINFQHKSIEEETTAEGYRKTSIQSETGRWVHIHHKNHLLSSVNITEIEFHHKTHESWTTKAEQTVDKLIQLMAEQRYAYESTSDNGLKAKLAEHQLSQFEFIDALISGRI